MAVLTKTEIAKGALEAAATELVSLDAYYAEREDQIQRKLDAAETRAEASETLSKEKAREAAKKLQELLADIREPTV